MFHKKGNMEEDKKDVDLGKQFNIAFRSIQQLQTCGHKAALQLPRVGRE